MWGRAEPGGLELFEAPSESSRFAFRANVSHPLQNSLSYIKGNLVSKTKGSTGSLLPVNILWPAYFFSTFSRRWTMHLSEAIATAQPEGGTCPGSSTKTCLEEERMQIYSEQRVTVSAVGRSKHCK